MFIDFLTSIDIVTESPYFQKLKREVFENPDIKKVAYNMKDHIKHLYPYGCSMINFDDVMVMSYVLNCGKHNQDLDTLITVILGENPSESLIAERDVVGIGKKKVSFATAPLVLATHYVCQFADYAARIYEKLLPELEANKRLTHFYQNIELPLVTTLSAIELHGVVLDKAGLTTMAEEYKQKIFTTANLIRKEAGYPEISQEELKIEDPDEEETSTTTMKSKSTTSSEDEFNVNSNRQLGIVIFDKLRFGREYAKKSGKSGDYVMNAEVLDLLSKKGIEIAKYILQYRALTKLYSTYIFGLQQHINPYTGRVHTTFQNALTVTGRLSSVSPNLQNIPVRTAEGKMIRKSFMAPDGHVILKVDYSQVELRILAHIANIDVLKDAFRNGKDVHAITASQVFKVPVEGMDKSLRNKAKAINFGIIYGMSEFGLSKRIEVDVPTAKRFIEQYFEQYPGIQKYMEKTKAFCRKHGFVNTLLGRKCWIPDITAAGAKRGFAERTCINTPIQGTSADITKIAMNRLYTRFKELNLRTKMIIQVHDEIVFEAPEDEVETVKPIIKEIMEGAAAEANFSVPLTVDIEQHKRWLEE
jgi:DNA polymerase-1